MSDLRVIKKYPNRRLYDTAISKYVTLSDVKQLVIDKEPVKVIDAKSKEDLTRSVLLQIIFEQEEDGSPILSAQMLEQIIRFYGDPYQSTMASFLEKSINVLSEQQTKAAEVIEQITDPLEMMAAMSTRNIEVWKDLESGVASNSDETEDK